MHYPIDLCVALYPSPLCWLRVVTLTWYVYAHRPAALAAEGNFKGEGYIAGVSFEL